jgi:non-ribosomal peptide synthase protein (TIGR01720 family)
MLRYLASDAAQAKRLQVRPEVCFNYLGQLGPPPGADRAFTVSAAPSGQWRHPGGRRPFLLEINSLIREGQLVIECSYGANRHRPATMERLLDEMVRALREIVEHCTSQKTSGHTPSDFQGANLSQDELDDLLSAYG